MEITIEDRGKMIINACLNEKSDDPIIIFQRLADQNFVRIHGPEHHIIFLKTRNV